MNKVDCFWFYSWFYFYGISRAKTGLHNKDWCTHGVHENCPIFKTPTHLVHLCPKFFYPFDLGLPVSSKPPSTPLRMITSQLKENIIQGWLSYITRFCLQVDFRFQYHLVNLLWLSTDIFSFSQSLTICFFVALYSCGFVLLPKKYYETSFICIYSHF